MKIVWLSANRLGYEVLKAASKVENVEITAILTLSEDAKTVMHDGVNRSAWNEFGIDVFEIERLNNETELLKKLAPDLVVMCGWRQIIDKEILDIPQSGFVGFHPTLLPKGRGPAPIINSILNGFEKSGITMFYVSEGLDDGDIIGQERFDIDTQDHASEVYEKVIIGGGKLIRTYLPLLAQGKAPRVPQDNTQATFFDKRALKDNKIDMDKESVNEIYKKIRAVSKPYKGAYIEKDGKKLIIWKAEVA